MGSKKFTIEGPPVKALPPIRDEGRQLLLTLRYVEPTSVVLKLDAALIMKMDELKALVILRIAGVRFVSNVTHLRIICDERAYDDVKKEVVDILYDLGL